MYRPSKTVTDKSSALSVASNLTGTQTILRCRDCGLVFAKQDILATGEEIHEILGESAEADYLKQDEERYFTFQRCLRLIERFAIKKGKLLDIGTGGGAFLRAAKAGGWQVSGVEINRHLTEYANSKFALNVRNGDFTALAIDEKFDVVCFWDSLEHTLNPKQQIEKALSVLNPGGILLINFPAIDSIFAKIFRANWWFFIPVHFYYFSRRVLRNLLVQDGAEVLYTGNHWQTLRLGHVLRQLSLWMPFGFPLLVKLTEGLGLAQKNLTYYAGQKIIIAKKR